LRRLPTIAPRTNSRKGALETNECAGRMMNRRGHSPLAAAVQYRGLQPVGVSAAGPGRTAGRAAMIRACCAKSKRAHCSTIHTTALYNGGRLLYSQRGTESSKGKGGSGQHSQAARKAKVEANMGKSAECFIAALLITTQSTGMN
jgi:hypothetical protein